MNIEEKAKRYAQSVVDEDTFLLCLGKDICDDHIEYASQCYTAGYTQAVKDLTRWRKVTEELPEHSGDPFLVRGHFKINERTSMISRYFAVYQDMDFYDTFKEVIFDAPIHFVVTEWMPIPQID